MFAISVPKLFTMEFKVWEVSNLQREVWLQLFTTFALLR